MNHPSPGALPGSYSESLYTLNESREISRLPVNGEVGLVKSTKLYATIDRLPPELLSKVFLVCAAPSEHNNFTCGDHLPWIAIAQVCVYWRSVALACGELWRWLIFSNPEATKEMVRRSNGVTLIVKACDGFRADVVYENVRMVISDMRRVSVLHLRFRSHHFYRLLQELSGAAPKLESLRLRTDGSLLNLSRPFDAPNVIFSEHTPSLRRLQLIYCKLSWQALPLRGLTHLDLRNPASPPTLAQFLSFLRGAPMLKSLILYRATPTDLLNPGVVSPRQLLPNLQVFTLGGSVDACTSHLQYLAYPNSVIASFVCEMPSNVNPDIHKFLQEAQSAVMHEGGDHVIRSLAVEIGFDHFALRCSAVCRSSAPFIPTEELPQLTVTLRPDYLLPMPTGELMHATMTALPLAEVQFLDIAPELRGVDWSGFLQRLPETQSIHLRKSPHEGFLKALADDGEKMGESARPVTLILPQLRSLWLTDIIFGEWDGKLQSLLACLRARVQGGSAIQVLRLLDCCDIYTKDVEMMKEFVQDVEWDGRAAT